MVPLEIAIVHVWVPNEEFESLVNATETLEIKRQVPGLTCITTPTNGETTTPSADHSEEKPAEFETTQSRVYYIQTKTLDRPVQYVSHVSLTILPPGMRFVGMGRVQDKTAIMYITTVYTIITLVLPTGLLRKILIGENSTISTTQSLGRLLTGIDQFASWERSWSDLFLSLLVSLKENWVHIAFALLVLLILILMIYVIITLPW